MDGVLDGHYMLPNIMISCFFAVLVTVFPILFFGDGLPLMHLAYSTMQLLTLHGCTCGRMGGDIRQVWQVNFSSFGLIGKTSAVTYQATECLCRAGSGGFWGEWGTGCIPLGLGLGLW